MLEIIFMIEFIAYEYLIKIQNYYETNYDKFIAKIYFILVVNVVRLNNFELINL